MQNTQPITRLTTNGMAWVHSMFYTIQGEGPFCGQPAVFIRLGGCNLQCPLCDTEYTESCIWLTGKEVGEAVEARHPHPGGLVVITGGEPLRQPAALKKILERLIGLGYRVQIESNGTLPPPILDNHQYATTPCDPRSRLYLVISPKTGKINPDALARCCALKYVVSHDSVAEDDGLPITALGHTANPRLARPPKGFTGPIYIQPADHQDEQINELNATTAKYSAMAYGYTVQIQIHKILKLE